MKSMHKIWKFDLNIGTSALQLPVGARFLDVQVQRGVLRAWFLLDPEARTETRIFEVFGTGHDVERAEHLTHLGTFQLNGGSLVLHVFERRS